MGRGRQATASEPEQCQTEAEWRRRVELAGLLVACRGRLARPAVPGIRGEGMRQEDIAALSGVSIRGYRSLEKAEYPASPKLAGLAGKVAAGMRMDPAERSALYVLATGQDPPRPVTVPGPAAPAGPGTALRHLADQMGRDPRLSPFPAGYTDATWTMLYCNQALIDWSGGWFSHGASCGHLICYLFSRHAEQALDGIGELRRTAIAALRYQYARNLADPAWAKVISCVTSGTESGPMWALHHVAFMPHEHTCRIRRPGAEPADARTIFMPLRPDLWLYTLVVPLGLGPPGSPAPALASPAPVPEREVRD